MGSHAWSDGLDAVDEVEDILGADTQQHDDEVELL